MTDNNSASAPNTDSAPAPRQPPMVGPVPTIGRILHYRLTKDQADATNKRRADSRRNLTMHRKHSTGVQIHWGNDVAEGDVFPMMIVRVWGDTPGAAVNGQVALDGNDVLWVTSVSVGDRPGSWAWPPRA